MTWNSKVRHHRPSSSPVLIPLTTLALLLAVPAYRVAASGQTAPPPRTYSTNPNPEVASTQDWSGEIPAHISVVDGPVMLEREGRAEAAQANVILLAGDRLRTARSRAEVLFADGSSLALDDYTTIDLLDSSLMRLVVGRTRLQIARATGDLEYRVDSISGSALIRTPGDYRLSLADARGATNPEFELAVLRGSADLVNDLGRTAVRAGARAVSVATAAPSPALVFNVALNDSFDRWTMDQRQARMGYQSAQYLPTEINYYSGAFDNSGSWEYYQPYGYVWYPVVPVGWRPYSTGRWGFAGHFGWFWIGYDSWSWPTHHYGRWGYQGSRWYWIPGNHWGPAWVSWASAPGYVGWCPLGYDNRAVFSFSYVSGGYGGYGYGHGGYDRWNGWTVLPARSFTPGVAVPRYAVPGRTLGADVVNRFAVRTAPDRPTTGFSRAPALGSPGNRGVAGPRATAGASRPDMGSRSFDNSNRGIGAGAAAATAGRVAPGGGSRESVSRGTAVPRENGISRVPSPQPRTGAAEQPRAETSQPSRSAPWNRPETIVGGRRVDPAPAPGAAAPSSPGARAIPRSPGGAMDSGRERVWTPPQTITSRPPQGDAPESRGYRPAPTNRGEAPARSIAAPRNAPPETTRTSPSRPAGTSSRPEGGNSSNVSRPPGRQAPPQGSGTQGSGSSNNSGGGRAGPRGGRGGGGGR